MSTPYHEGELAVQARAGVRGMAFRIGGSIVSEMSPAVQDFLGQQTFLVAASVDPLRRIWASILASKSGVAHALDESTLMVRACTEKSDPLHKSLGLTAWASARPSACSPATLAPVHVNGTVTQAGDDTFTLRVEQAYGNCPKYIQKRDGEPASTTASTTASTAANAATARVGHANRP